MNREKFFALFGRRRPSVQLFYALLNEFPQETREEYYRFACFLFLNEFFRLSLWNKTFIGNLVKNDPQRFLNYLLSTSGFTVLRCRLVDWKPIIQLFHLLMANRENVKFTFEQISFFICLSFDIPLKISSLGVYIRQYRFTPETFFEFAEYVGIYL